MSRAIQILKSLGQRSYRRAFRDDIGTGLAFQIKLLRERRGQTQEELAERIGKRQETISQWENPNYGRYTLKTLLELAEAFDVALIVRFAPFRDLAYWTATITPDRLAPKTYEEEMASDEMKLYSEAATEFLPKQHVEEGYIYEEAILNTRDQGQSVTSSLISEGSTSGGSLFGRSAA